MKSKPEERTWAKLVNLNTVTGIVTDLNLLQRPLSTRNVPVNVSPSTLMFNWLVFTANLPVYFFRDG